MSTDFQNPRASARGAVNTAHVHDHRPEAASLLNLAALCQRCHLNHDKLLHQKNASATRRARARTLELPLTEQALQDVLKIPQEDRN